MKKIVYYALLCAVAVSANACKNTAKDKEKEQTTAELSAVSEPVVVVTEEAVYGAPVPAPVVKEADTKPEKSTKQKETKKVTPKISCNELKKSLATANITPTKTVDTTFFSFSTAPINSTQTITSYEKNGTEVLKVVSDPTDPDIVDYIIFTDKKGNVDFYGVSFGLSTKEAKELRKELKHFVKKGKVFLYTDDSNILYELDGLASDGKAVTEDYIDSLHVSSIIWKDKTDNKTK